MIACLSLMLILVFCSVFSSSFTLANIAFANVPGGSMGAGAGGGSGGGTGGSGSDAGSSSDEDNDDDNDEDDIDGSSDFQPPLPGDKIVIDEDGNSNNNDGDSQSGQGSSGGPKAIDLGKCPDPTHKHNEFGICGPVNTLDDPAEDADNIPSDESTFGDDVAVVDQDNVADQVADTGLSIFGTDGSSNPGGTAGRTAVGGTAVGGTAVGGTAGRTAVGGTAIPVIR